MFNRNKIWPPEKVQNIPDTIKKLQEQLEELNKKGAEPKKDAGQPARPYRYVSDKESKQGKKAVLSVDDFPSL